MTPKTQFLTVLAAIPPLTVDVAAASPPSFQPFVTGAALLVQRRDYLASAAADPALAWRVAEMFALILLLMGLYGFAMGMFASIRQALASALKLPLLFLLSLAVGLPLLYVINTLFGIHFGLLEMLVVPFSALALAAILLVSFAPIVAFFGVGSSYHFIKLAHVGIIAACSLYALRELHAGLALLVASLPDVSEAALRIFVIWVGIFAFIGMQMAWTLRPFLGAPDLEFVFVRRRGGGMNFYVALIAAVEGLLRSSGDASPTTKAVDPEAGPNASPDGPDAKMLAAEGAEEAETEASSVGHEPTSIDHPCRRHSP